MKQYLKAIQAKTLHDDYVKILARNHLNNFGCGELKILKDN